MSLKSWFMGLSGLGKVATVGVVGAGVVLATRSAYASPSSSSGSGGTPYGGSSPSGSQPGAQVGDAFSRLSAGTRVRLPDAWHLRARPTATAAGTDVAMAGGEVVEVIAPVTAPGSSRGSRERMYRVQLINADGTRGSSGYAFVPYNATRV